MQRAQLEDQSDRHKHNRQHDPSANTPVLKHLRSMAVQTAPSLLNSLVAFPWI